MNVYSCVNPCVHMKVCSYVNPHVHMFLCACVDVCICICKPKVHVGCPPQLFSAFCIFISFITCECICVGMRVPRNTCYSEHEEVRGPSVEISSLHLPHGSQARTRVMERSSRHTYALGLLANPSVHILPSSCCGAEPAFCSTL